MENDSRNKYTSEETVEFSFREFFNLCLDKWYWFLICAAFAVGIALFYIYRKQPEYNRYEQILINDQDTGGNISDVSGAFSTLGLFSKNTNVFNELLTMTSPAVLYEVADSLQLDMNYSEKDGLRAKTLYGKNLPFKVDMLDIDKQGEASFRMRLEPNGDMELFKFRRRTPEELIKYKEEIKVPAGTTMITTPIGLVKISSNPEYIPDGKDKTKILNISKIPMQSTVELYGAKLSGDLADDDADVIELSIDDVSVQRAVDILNCILLVYNQNYLRDKNRMSNATSKFIQERLNVIQQELTDVDNSIAAYKRDKGIPDVQAQLTAAMELGAKMEEELIQTSNELSVAKYMKEFLVKNDDINTVLPANLGVRSGELSLQINAYNELLMNRNTIANNSSDSNPLVKSYDQQLRQMRKAIEASVNNSIANLQEQVAYMSQEIGERNSVMANSPETYLPLLTEERQRMVKQDLYLFLLQKQEENELTQKFTTDNIRVITPPVGSLKPVSPKKGLIIIVALILGFGIPIILLYYLEATNTKVRNKKDLSPMIAPLTGEIPNIEGKGNLKKRINKNPLQKKEEAPFKVVEEGKRDIVNEAFRVIRGNIDFMSGKKTTSEVIMLTSLQPGSGKSFISLNLALSFAIKGKKVLIIDCDLRHASSSMIVGSPSEGISSYLTGNVSDWRTLVVNSKETPGVSVLPVGKIPPNPAELLEDGKLQELVEQARKDYDIIFLDCPPVNIVVDSQIIAPLADITLFIVRTGLFDKSDIKELNAFYREKKYKNISVILNGTEIEKNRYSHYGNYQ